MKRCSSTNTDREGFALIAVLLVLMALFLLTAPFLFTTTSAERASKSRGDRSQTTLALDTAARHARARLSRSHASLDETPFSDTLEELVVDTDFPVGSYDNQDPRAAQWDLEVQDVAGMIDLNSAPPQVFGNLFGATGSLTGDLPSDATEVTLTSTEGLEPSGVLWLGPELVAYSGIEGNTLTGLERGLGVQFDEEGEPEPCGPSQAISHGVGATSLDQRAEAIPAWRTGGGDGFFRELDGLERAAEAQGLVLAGSFAVDDLATLREATTVYAKVGAGPRWQRGTRLTARVDGTTGRSCRLFVDDSRWFNPGTTVRIEGGGFSEVAIVRSVGRGRIGLDRPLVGVYEAFRAIVRPLARRPVNVNTASPEVLRALVLNLRLVGRQKFITSRKADLLVEVILESRPFDGFEDFLRRVVLPSAGLEELPEDAPVVPEVFAPDPDSLVTASSGANAFLDRDDALALYKNALNANDAELGFSTMPFAFTSRDVHRLHLRSTVAAESGVNRGDAVREEVLLASPQESLLKVWTRQEEFDLAGRMHRTLPGWVTGPVNTLRHDAVFRSWHPTEARAHLGPNDTQPWDASAVTNEEKRGSFPDRELGEAWATLRPARVDDGGPRSGRVLHFDHEERSPDGRYLPDGVFQRDPSDAMLGWSSGDGLARPIQFEAWLKPFDLDDGATFLDVGGAFPDSDRYTLFFHEGSLVFRALDAAGDHPDTVFEEFSELRYAFSGDKGPGIQPDTWVHVALEASGTKPTQMQMLIDGQAWARTPGLTRLVGGLDPTSGTIKVESTEGFPDVCVLRIGEELVEATRLDETTFGVAFQTQGELAGYGGRIAREVFTGIDPGINLGATKDTAHPPGSAVEHYGYTLPISTNVPSGGGTLTSPLGPFAVSRMIGIVKNGERTERQMEPITVITPGGFTYTIGFGLDGVADDVESLVLAPADGPDANVDHMGAFSTSGGYAAIVARRVAVRLTDPTTGLGSDSDTDLNSSPIGGVEVVRYSGVSGNRLVLAARGNAVSELTNLGNVAQDSDIGGRRAFIGYWEDGITVRNGQASPNDLLTWQVMVVPISVPVTGANAGNFLQAGNTLSQFAQITRLGSETQLTEWVRYDELVRDQLVRDEPTALQAMQRAALGGEIRGDAEGTIEDPDDDPGGTGGTGGTGGFGGGPGLPSPTPPAAGKRVAGSFWEYRLSEPTDTDLPVTRAVATQFQHRGVFGTSANRHLAGASVLPVWQVPAGDLSAGRVGRLDPVFLFSDDLSDPGFPGTIHYAHQPREYTTASYDDGNGELEAVASEESTVFHTGVVIGRSYVALQQPLPVPIAFGTNNPNAQGLPLADTRIYARVMKFPSGERPRIVVNAAVGGPAADGADGTVPSAVIDEVVFGNGVFGGGALGEGGLGGQLVLERPFLDGDDVLEVVEDTLRTPVGNVRVQGDLLSALPRDGGLLRIGKELVVYQAVDTDSDLIVIAEGGRGVLGTQVDGHALGEGVAWVESARVGFLSAGIGGGDAVLRLGSVQGFPARGTVLVGDELIHYDWVVGNALVMPSRSRASGSNDGAGGGLWRGRFGTNPSSHPSGTPVIVFPIRYWDRWADDAEAPEMHFFQLGVDAPSAYWQRTFFEVEESPLPGPRLGVLVRTDPDAPWDTPADAGPGLRRFYEADPSRGGERIGRQSDAVDWRVFVRYEPGSFEALGGTQSGWKTAPRLKQIGVEYLSPWIRLEQVER